MQREREREQQTNSHYESERENMRQEREGERDWWKDELKKLEEELAQGRQKFRKEMGAKMEQDRRQAEESSQKMFEEARQGKGWNSNGYNSNYSSGGETNNSTSNQDSSSSNNSSDWRKKLKERRKKWERENEIWKENQLQFKKNLAIDHIIFCLDLWEVSENELNQILGGINWKTEIDNTEDSLEIYRKERSLKNAIDKIRKEKKLTKEKIDAVEHINNLINIHSKNYSSEEKQELKNQLGNWDYDLCQASSDSELWSKKWQLQEYGGKIDKAVNKIYQKRLEKIKNTKSSSIPKYRQRTSSSARRGNELVGLVFLMIIIGSIVGIVMYFRNKKRKSESEY